MPLQLYFATGNKNKLNEAKAFLESLVPGLSLKQCVAELVELQADTLEEVARYKIEGAMKACKGSVFIEDAGLFVPALHGFPGVFSAEVKKMLDCNGILKLMDNYTQPEQRAAYFEACTCLYLKETEEIMIFTGRIDGTLAFEERGDQGFGFDPIFIPGEPDGNTRTFAELSIEEKNEISHRAKSLQKLKDFLLSLA